MLASALIITDEKLAIRSVIATCLTIERLAADVTESVLDTPFVSVSALFDVTESSR